MVKRSSGGLNVSDFSAHSLRSGLLTSAPRRGASVFKMRDASQGGALHSDAHKKNPRETGD
jgi:hypothetical protein